MKKLKIYRISRGFVLILFLLIAGFSFSQNDSVIISGYVFRQNMKIPIENAKVKLMASNGEVLESNTGKSGYYRFKLTPNINSATVTVNADRTTKCDGCHHSFFSSKDAGVFDLNKGDSFSKDFFLFENKGCYGPPEILFKYNSINPVQKTLWVTDSISYNDALEAFVRILKDNPEIVAEISAHASSNEQNTDTLSIKRARFIREELVKKGINTRRLECKGYGKNRSIYSNATIQNAKTKKEKDALHQKNRMVYIKILRFDFVEPKKEN